MRSLHTHIFIQYSNIYGSHTQYIQKLTIPGYYYFLFIFVGLKLLRKYNSSDCLCVCVLIMNLTRCSKDLTAKNIFFLGGTHLKLVLFKRISSKKPRPFLPYFHGRVTSLCPGLSSCLVS